MESDLVNFFFERGLLGVIVLVEAYIIVKFYNRIEKIEAEKQAIGNEWRLDSKDTTNKVTTVMSDYSQNIRILTEKIVVGKQNNDRDNS